MTRETSAGTIDRRGFLLGSLAALLAGRPGRAAAGPAATADACIVLWMNGGPSHLDTFDPKPGQQTGGPFKDIATSVPEVRISEHLPQLAELCHHLAILRGVTTREGNHQRAQHLLHTGYPPNPTVDYPAFGSWVSAERAPPGLDLPGFVSIRGPAADAGFLGVSHGPFLVQVPGQVPDNTDYPRDVDFVRFVRRQSALSYLEGRFLSQTGDEQVRGRRTVHDRAVRMMYSPRLAAFDLSEEPESALRAYGESDFGRGCLLARRLVEAGVRFVEVVLDGWDTHKDNFGKTRALMKVLDPAMAALLRDLDERKRLGRTLIAWMGEFGRTPKINPDEGRDHHPGAFSAVLCGGGVRGGLVYGRTDPTGTQVVERPVLVPDLFATMATLLGMDPDREVRSPIGRPVAITQNGQPIRELIA